MIRDDANDWFESQGQEIQDYEAPAMPEYDEAGMEAEEVDADERPYGDVPEVRDEDVRNVTNLRAIATPTAAVIVGTLDVVVPLLVTLVVRGSEREDCRLTEEERGTLTEAWATYLGDKNVAVSPGGALAIAMVTIYGAKVVGALASRRERRELAEARGEAARLRAELAEARARVVDLEAAQRVEKDGEG